MLPDSGVAKMNLEFLDLVKGLNWKNKTNIKQALYVNWNLSNPTCIRRENVCRNRHGVWWHGVKQTENGKKDMKFNVGLQRDTDYTGVILDRFYCKYLWDLHAAFTGRYSSPGNCCYIKSQ